MRAKAVSHPVAKGAKSLKNKPGAKRPDAAGAAKAKANTKTKAKAQPSALDAHIMALCAALEASRAPKLDAAALERLSDLIGAHLAKTKRSRDTGKPWRAPEIWTSAKSPETSMQFWTRVYAPLPIDARPSRRQLRLANPDLIEALKVVVSLNKSRNRPGPKAMSELMHTRKKDESAALFEARLAEARARMRRRRAEGKA